MKRGKVNAIAPGALVAGSNAPTNMVGSLDCDPATISASMTAKSSTGALVGAVADSSMDTMESSAFFFFAPSADASASLPFLFLEESASPPVGNGGTLATVG